MDTTAFDRLRADFVKARGEAAAAAVGAVGSAVAYLLLLLLLYLFIDLLVGKGQVSPYAQLSPARKAEFAAEWRDRSDDDRAAAVRRLGLTDPVEVARVSAADPAPPPTPGEWEFRRRAGVYLALRDRVGPDAADLYLPEAPAGADADHNPRLGVLGLVVRERNRWTGHVVGWVASWNRWMWQPGPDGSADRAYLTGLFVLALGVALARGVMLNAVAYFAAAATLDATTRLRRAIYYHTFRLGSLAVRTAGPGEAAGLITREVEAAGGAIQAALTAPFRHPVQFFLLLGLILLIHFWLAVSFLVLALLVWLVAGQVAAFFRREARIGRRQGEATLGLLQESMSLLRLVKTYQMDRFNQARVERQLAESGRASWRRLRGEAVARPLLVSVALVALVALLYLGGWAVLAGEFSAAGLAVMAVALVSLVAPLAGWLDARGKLRRGRAAADSIYEYLDRRGEAAEAADAEFLPPLTTRVEFRNVTLKEPGTGRPLLDGVSFAVPAGAKVAVVGPDPAELRALVYLLPRFLDPTSGEVRIEDKNIRWVTHESLRAQVAVVAQDDLVFSDTAANNIGCGDPGYNLPQVIEAAKLAHAHQFIERLPYGYETVVGAQGHALRPGEQFRIGLARALLRDPSVLVIEEPSAADEDTLALLDDTLERVGPGRTVIFLARRLSTLRAVNRVFVLKDDKLEGSGTHRDLWQSNVTYRRLQVIADATLESAASRG